ncbi:MAG: 4Fe-4S dicluster domain-containing protein [Desulfovibrionaceae bacterium]|nr:4Fe-4S dicluster domain-containing protein [Desulfovibrionaceae bacterium]
MSFSLDKSDPNFTKQVAARSGQNIASCYQCGNCAAGCPAGFAYDIQVNQIMRGLQLGLKDYVLQARSLWFCLSCSTCSLRCPNNIDVAQIMETLRHMARDEHKVSVSAVDKFFKSFLTTVRFLGRSYEIGTMVLFMLRSGHLTTDVDLAPQALLKQKLSILPHKTPPNVKATARIFERFLKGKHKQVNN